MAGIKTLQIKLFFGKIALLGVLWILLSVGCAEGLARVRVIQKHMLAPSVGIAHREFEIEVDRLRVRAAQKGRPDCIFLGSSKVLDGIDPEAMQAAYEEQTGKTLICQNFGVNGMGMLGETQAALALINLYQPRLIIFGTGFQDIHSGDVDQMIAQNPWVRYNLGQFSFDGWVTNSFLSYRYYLAGIGYLTTATPQDQRDFLTWQTILPDGFHPLTGRAANASSEKPGTQNYIVPPDSIEAIQTFMKEKSQNTQVLFVEMPISPAMYNNNTLAENNRSKFVNTMNTDFDKSQVKIWFTQDLNLIPDERFYDPIHLNATGAKILSAWIGEELGKAVKNGALALPN
jgi:hypothetical protein